MRGLGGESCILRCKAGREELGLRRKMGIASRDGRKNRADS